MKTFEEFTTLSENNIEDERNNGSNATDQANRASSKANSISSHLKAAHLHALAAEKYPTDVDGRKTYHMIEAKKHTEKAFEKK